MNTPSLHQRAIGAYLGLAIGDALGATVEFMTPREIKAAYGVHNRITGGGWLRLKAGQVTDDTTMALALGRSILEMGRVDALAAARAFDAWMRDKPVDIGNTVRRGIVWFRHSGDPVSPPNDNDAGNGACMRALPVALATLGCNETEMMIAARAQAHVTHNNPLSDVGTECVIRMVQGALTGMEPMDLLHGPVRSLIQSFPRFRFRGRRVDNPSGFIVETLQAVFQAVFDTESFEDCLVDVVNRGGDADTTGAIAGMIAGAIYGAAAIPRPWLSALNPAVRSACEGQALALLALSPLQSQM